MTPSTFAAAGHTVNTIALQNVGATPRVSVVIPLYNHEKYIDAAIDSVLSQTVPVAEIIVIDDGSTDSSAAKVRELCKDHPQIIFWSWPNQGAHHTLNAGILRATGDFVAILNSDDCYHPQRLASCLDAVQADPTIDVVTSAVSSVDERGEKVSNPWYEEALAFYRREGDLPLALFHANFLVTTSNLFVRRSVFESIGKFAPLRYTHDLEFVLRLVLDKRHVHFLDQPLLAYRMHGKNTISESKVSEDVERAAVFAYFIYRHCRVEVDDARLHAALERYAKVLSEQDILEIVEDFLSRLEGKLHSGAATALGSLEAEFQSFLSRLGVDWIGPGNADLLLTRFEAARKVFMRRRKDAKNVAALKADIQWSIEQRNAWEKTARVQEAQIKALKQESEELRAGNTWLLEQRDAWQTAAQTQETQINVLTQRTEELRAGNAWLLEQRDTWEQAARSQEEQATSLTEALQEMRNSNAQLMEQRNGWAQVATERARKNDELSKKLLEALRTVSELKSQRTEIDRQIASLREERNHIFGFAGWKITKTLRHVGRRLSSVFSGLLGTMDSRKHEHDVPVAAELGSSSMLRLTGQKHRILLVLHEFSRTGAPRAVLYLARAIFLLKGIRPVVVAPKDGPIRDEFENEGFPTLVDSSLLDPARNSSDIVGWVAGFEHVIVTPLSSFVFVRHFKGSMKRLTWWIHEEALGFAYIAENFSADLTSLFDACDAVWLGSPLCFQPAAQYAAQEKLHLLLYGCDDVSTVHQPHPSGRMVFTLAGSVEPRKGQDIFLKAIERLDSEVRHRAIFRMVGSSYNEWSANFQDKVYSQASQIPEIELIPNVPFDELQRLYAQTDIVVSSSRADPMPISITQGMMFSKVCLCSSAIGHAQLLEDGKSGLIFANESVEQLAEKITWLIQNPAELPALGVSSRAVYEKYFLMDGFINNLNVLLNENGNIEIQTY